jgi:N-acetylglutamate synthase-like GNAT family acetyltransferase
MSLVVHPAQSADYEAIARLLQNHKLPLDGLRDHLATTVVARDADAIVGSAALEMYEDGALLRSVAVAPGRQHTGLGRTLVDAAIDLARSRDIPALYLLTTTAERYFPRFGFERIDRGDVPPGVQQSVEFTSACPASAIVMRKTL